MTQWLAGGEAGERAGVGSLAAAGVRPRGSARPVRPPAVQGCGERDRAWCLVSEGSGKSGPSQRGVMGRVGKEAGPRAFLTGPLILTFITFDPDSEPPRVALILPVMTPRC